MSSDQNLSDIDQVVYMQMFCTCLPSRTDTQNPDSVVCACDACCALHHCGTATWCFWNRFVVKWMPVQMRDATGIAVRLEVSIQAADTHATKFMQVP